MRAFTSSIARASPSARTRSARRMWNASRCAVFGPMPGSRESSWIRRSSGSGSAGMGLEEAGREPQAGGDRLHLRRRHLLRLLHRLVDGGDDQVLQHLRVAGRLGVDAHRDQLLRAGRDDRDRASARRRLDGLRLELLLNFLHPVLHLLDLAQHLHGVFHSDTSLTRVTRPSNRRTISRTNGSSSGLAGLCLGTSFSRRRKSIRTSPPSHARTCGISCADCSCAFLWWKPYLNHSTSTDPSTSGCASRYTALTGRFNLSSTSDHPAMGAGERTSPLAGEVGRSAAGRGGPSDSTASLASVASTRNRGSACRLTSPSRCKSASITPDSRRAAAWSCRDNAATNRSRHPSINPRTTCRSSPPAE